MSENFILAYYQKIKDGTVTAGRWIRLGYERIVHGIEAHEYIYDQKKAYAAILFIENYCRHSEGDLGGQKLRLELWQKAFVSVVFGIVDEKGRRQFTEVALFVGRKMGKTILAAAIAAYCTYCDGEYGGRVYFVAPKLEQANLCYGAYYQIIKSEPALQALTKKRRTDIYIENTNTMAKPLAFSEKKSDGLNISCCVADEIAAWAGDGGLKFYEVLKSSFGARRQPLLLSISSGGYVSEGEYDELFKRGTRVLLGDSKERRFAPFFYTIDDIEKWNDINELYKSLPNLGVSVSVDYILDEIAVAEGSLPKKAEFLTKYCNVKQNSSQAWLSAEDVGKASGEPLRLEDFRDCYCIAGVDLSRTTDLTSACVVIEKGGELYIFAHFWLPRERVEEATARDGLPYMIYEKRGLISFSGDNFVDYHDCFNWLRDLVRLYKVFPLEVMYDRYCAQYLIQDLQAAGFQTDDCYQGFNMTPGLREFEGLMKNGQVHIGDNDLLKIHLLNAALKFEGDTERVKLVKLGQYAHIDGTAAVIDAMIGRQKYHGLYGKRLQNAGAK